MHLGVTYGRDSHIVVVQAGNIINSQLPEHAFCRDEWQFSELYSPTSESHDRAQLAVMEPASLADNAKSTLLCSSFMYGPNQPGKLTSTRCDRRQNVRASKYQGRMHHGAGGYCNAVKQTKH